MRNLTERKNVVPWFNHQRFHFHYVDHGKGMPFVFQHGLGGSTEQTAGLFPGTEGVRFLSLDCRSHGETEPLAQPEELRFSLMADDIVAWMDHLGLENVVLGGISMGAGIALNLALRYPTRVRGLMLSRPAWLDGPMEARRFYFEVADLIRSKGVEEGQLAFLASPTYAKLRLESPDTANSLLGQFKAPRAKERVSRLEEIPRDTPHPDRKQWAAIKVPALVLATDTDPIHPLQLARTLVEAIPNAEFRQVTSKSLDPALHVREVQSTLGNWLEAFGS
jgi:pimeloyl-ACP methyl ester carboxylesterase